MVVDAFNDIETVATPRVDSLSVGFDLRFNHRNGAVIAAGSEASHFAVTVQLTGPGALSLKPPIDDLVRSSRIRGKCLPAWENGDVEVAIHPAQEALSVRPVSRGIDRIEVTFDEPNLVANAGLLLVATLVVRLGLERLINDTVDLSGRVGGALPGRKVLTLVHAMVAGGSHIDHADVLRAGATRAVLAPPGDGTLHPRHVPAVLHLRSCPPTRCRLGRGTAPGLGPRGRARRRTGWSSTSTPPSARCAARPSTVPATATPRSSATTPSSPPGPAPASSSTSGCARARPTPSGAPSASSKSWWPGCAGPGPPASWSCASTRGSGRTPPSPPSSAWTSATPWGCGW